MGIPSRLIAFDRPDKRNALTPEMLDRTQRPSHPKHPQPTHDAIVLTGDG